MDRPLSHIIAAPFQRQFYAAYINMARSFERPIVSALAYTFNRGRFPGTWTVRTPLGPRAVMLDTADDMVTLVECFGKIDYPAAASIRRVVDFGANIGISSLYFLTRNPHVFVHLYEPVERNLERLRANLRGFEDRYEIVPKAVGTSKGRVSFGVEPTGRYGGVGKPELAQIEVDIIEADAELQRLIGLHGSIDIVKIDIEGLEKDVLVSFSASVLDSIGAIYAETFGFDHDLPGFMRSQRGSVTRYVKQRGVISFAAPHV